MASWDDVKSFVKSKFKVDDKGDYFSTVFDTGNSRSQMVIMSKFTTNSGDVWVQISSPVGVIPQNKLDAALAMLDDKVCGGLVKIGDKHVVRHCMPIADLSQEELMYPLGFVTATADDLEAAFVGGDTH